MLCTQSITTPARRPREARQPQAATTGSRRNRAGLRWAREGAAVWHAPVGRVQPPPAAGEIAPACSLMRRASGVAPRPAAQSRRPGLPRPQGACSHNSPVKPQRGLTGRPSSAPRLRNADAAALTQACKSVLRFCR
ncbi:MAG: hypothetical protein Pg6A_15180 [Termitinemataceae bacterium]|nr:MAG: hypothetical protein Pg6A_15180 [Termitinemataceae bacterium]